VGPRAVLDVVLKTKIPSPYVKLKEINEVGNGEWYTERFLVTISPLT
jgi:hypothetical protein